VGLIENRFAKSGNLEIFEYAAYPVATRDFGCSSNGPSLLKIYPKSDSPNYGNRSDLKQITRPFKMCAFSDAIG
jgi:hypothetical protein